MRKFSLISENNNITSIAIGKFDSMHIGHMSVLRYLNDNGAVLLIKMPNNLSGFIVPYDKRHRYITNDIYYVDFHDIIDLSGIEFLDYLRSKLPHLKTIIVGYDFRFGKGRSYSGFDIPKISNLNVNIINEVCLDGIPLHSSYIRECIVNGDVDLASKMLGRFYSIEGGVVPGQGLGQELIFPTINIETNLYVLPKNGVYASYTSINDTIFQSVTFVGNRLSTNMSFAIETHIIDKDIIDSPNKVEIFFVKYIRENRKFTSLCLLKDQIIIDIHTSKKILGGSYCNER